MKRPFSIALRLAVWLSIGTSVLWLGAAAISTNVLRHELAEAFDDTLRQSAYRLLPLALHDLREPSEHALPIAGALGAERSSFTYLVYDSAGDIVIRADDAPLALSSVPSADGFFSIGQRHAFAANDRRTGFGIVVLETSDYRDEALWDAAGALFWPLAGLLPLGAAGIWFAVRLAMRPVERLRREIAERGGGNLTPLSNDGHPKELAPIALEVAALLLRLKAAMDVEKNFAANSAHELRTPIAGALAQTQRLAYELGDHPAGSRVREVESSLRKLSQLSEKLLQLARLDAGFARSDVPADLRPVIDLVVRDFQAMRPVSDRVSLTVLEDSSLYRSIDPDAFAIALRNLIQNGLSHGETDAVVEVIAGPGPVLHVRSQGPVVPAELLARLSQRFTRGETASRGTGLGLSIVDAIMEQSGGRLSLHSPAPGQNDGFEAQLTLP
jgi:two-component system OmpR family sensor kinase